MQKRALSHKNKSAHKVKQTYNKNARQKSNNKGSKDS